MVSRLTSLFNLRHFVSMRVRCHPSGWNPGLQHNTAADKSEATLRHSPLSPLADQIKCFITLHSIQSVFQFLSLCLIRHLYLLSGSIHLPAATFLQPVLTRQLPTATARKFPCIQACLHAHYISNFIIPHYQSLSAVEVGSEGLGVLCHWL